MNTVTIPYFFQLFPTFCASSANCMWQFEKDPTFSNFFCIEVVALKVYYEDLKMFIIPYKAEIIGATGIVPNYLPMQR